MFGKQLLLRDRITFSLWKAAQSFVWKEGWNLLENLWYLSYRVRVNSETVV